MENHQFLGYPGSSNLPTSSSSSSALSFSPNTANTHDGDGGGGGVEMNGKGKGGGEKKIRKHRFAFQTRSHVDILDDGYRWRKYGQKAVKNNKFPRSYYRCTYKDCNVKKQVQRLSKDEEVVVTTYEGIHTHPVEKPTHENFEHILSQMHSYCPRPSHDF